MDYTADTVYFLDIFIQLRTGYLEQGRVNRSNRIELEILVFFL
jgi:hypothetical protein